MEQVVLPWLKPMALQVPHSIGAGLDQHALRESLQRLVGDPEVKALVAFGSRARGEARPDSDLDLAVISAAPQLQPQQKLQEWSRLRKQLDSVGVGVDLIVSGWQDAARMAQSRWHVMGDVAREGKVLYVAG